MGPRNVLDGRGKSRPPPGFDPRLFWLVASSCTDSLHELNTSKRHLVMRNCKSHEGVWAPGGIKPLIYNLDTR